MSEQKTVAQITSVAHISCEPTKKPKTLVGQYEISSFINELCAGEGIYPNAINNPHISTDNINKTISGWKSDFEVYLRKNTSDLKSLSLPQFIQLANSFDPDLHLRSPNTAPDNSFKKEGFSPIEEGFFIGVIKQGTIDRVTRKHFKLRDEINITLLA